MEVAPHEGAWIEIPCRFGGREQNESHPTRVRGLKWIRKSGPLAGKRSHPTRVRGLKYHRGGLHRRHGESHPTRVRGLKYQPSGRAGDFRRVAPHEGAWIEIISR